jgi:hypothetical protein
MDLFQNANPEIQESLQQVSDRLIASTVEIMRNTKTRGRFTDLQFIIFKKRYQLKRSVNNEYRSKELMPIKFTVPIHPIFLPLKVSEEKERERLFRKKAKSSIITAALIHPKRIWLV